MRHHLDLAMLVTAALVIGAAGLVFVLEEGSGGSIDTLGKSLWWAAATVTTVGYGDVYPVTPAGRGVAVVLMLGGITLFGFITANLAAFLIERPNLATSDPTDDGKPSDVQALTRQVAELHCPPRVD